MPIHAVFLSKMIQLNSYQSALTCDPTSAFGGIVACNYKIKKKLAVQLNKIFLEVVVSNGFEKDALKILKKRKNLRLIDANNLSRNKVQVIFYQTLIQF